MTQENYKLNDLVNGKIKEGDNTEITECIDAINNAENKNVLHSRIGQLRQLSNNRVAHQKEVLLCLDKCLDNSLVMKNLETYRLVVETLENILYREQELNDSHSEEILRKVTNDFVLKLINIVSDTREYFGYSISFLSKSGRREAVNLIFDQINNDPSKALSGVVNSLSDEIVRALARLYPKHKRTIEKHIDKLIGTNNEDKTFKT